MEDGKKGLFLAGFCSVVYLIVAVGLLLGVCGYCYPSAGQWIKAVVVGAEDSPVRTAFNVLSDGLEAGTPLKEAARDSVAVLIGDAD